MKYGVMEIAEVIEFLNSWLGGGVYAPGEIDKWIEDELTVVNGMVCVGDVKRSMTIEGWRELAAVVPQSISYK